MIEEHIRTFKLGASYTIGSHILPGEPLDSIHQRVECKIKLTISPCDEIIDGIKEGKFDLGLIESPIFDDELVYREWMEDELVICSKESIPDSLDEDDLSVCRLICRKEGSLTRDFISDCFTDLGLSYQTFKSLSEIDNPTAMIQSIKWAKPNKQNPTVAIVSKLAIEDELKYNELNISRIYDRPMVRKFHLIYNNRSEDIDLVDDIIKYLQVDFQK